MSSLASQGPIVYPPTGEEAGLMKAAVSMEEVRVPAAGHQAEQNCETDRKKILANQAFLMESMKIMYDR
jgi:hypothetical protein